MEIIKFFEERKFMWDGRTYASESEALTIKAEYKKNNFETRLVQEGGNYFLFTYRVVTEVEIDTQQ